MDTGCATFREAISARLDDEAMPVTATDLDRHVAGCPDCATWADATAVLVRRTRVATAPAVPDLTASILAAVPSDDSRVVRRRQLRGVLAVAGVVQLVVAALTALPALGLHATRELGVFELALGVGFLVVARMPQHAAGLLPVVAVVAVVGVVGGVGDVVTGGADPVTELAAHAAELVGAAALRALVRDTGWRSTRPAVASS